MIRLSVDGVHLWPCRCPEHIGTDVQLIGHDLAIRWYSPIPDRAAAEDQAHRMAWAVRRAGFADVTVLVDDQVVTKPAPRPRKGGRRPV